MGGVISDICHIVTQEQKWLINVLRKNTCLINLHRRLVIK